VRLAVFSSERVPIRASRPARDAPLMIADVTRGGFPGVIVGHRAFDGEHAAIVVGDDQVEWLGRIRSGHPLSNQMPRRGPAFRDNRSLDGLPVTPGSGSIAPSEASSGSIAPSERGSGSSDCICSGG
jgi:hypothetical protein